VAASSVVVPDESVQGSTAGGVAGPGAGVGPFVEQGPVEPLGFAVGPGAPGLGEPSFDLSGGADPRPVHAVPVDERVVGQDPPDPDSLGGEPGQRPVQERRTGGVFLVVEHLAVDQPGVVVDRGVDALVADLGLLVPVGDGDLRGPAVRSPAATGRDPAAVMIDFSDLQNPIWWDDLGDELEALVRRVMLRCCREIEQQTAGRKAPSSILLVAIAKIAMLSRHTRTRDHK
jgi:hypothetical protein